MRKLKLKLNPKKGPKLGSEAMQEVKQSYISTSKGSTGSKNSTDLKKRTPTKEEKYQAYLKEEKARLAANVDARTRAYIKKINNR